MIAEPMDFPERRGQEKKETERGDAAAAGSPARLPARAAAGEDRLVRPVRREQQEQRVRQAQTERQEPPVRWGQQEPPAR